MSEPYRNVLLQNMYIVTKIHDKICKDEHTVYIITILTVNHLIPVPHKGIKTQSKEQRKREL